LEDLVDGVIIITFKGNIIFFNKAAEKNVGL